MRAFLGNYSDGNIWVKDKGILLQNSSTRGIVKVFYNTGSEFDFSISVMMHQASLCALKSCSVYIRWKKEILFKSVRRFLNMRKRLIQLLRIKQILMMSTLRVKEKAIVCNTFRQKTTILCLKGEGKPYWKSFGLFKILDIHVNIQYS